MKLTDFSFANFCAGALAIALPLSQAFAGGPLNLNPNDPDNFTRWANGGANIPFNTDLGGLGPLDNAGAVQQTVDAFQIWQDVPSSSATYSNEGPLAFDVDVTNFAPFIDNLFNGNNNADGLSPIVYDEDGSIFVALFGVSGVLGFASQDTFDANGVPIEAVSFLNGGAINDGFPLSDFFGVQVHEFGHYSGLAHTVVNGQNVALGDTTGPTPNNTFGDAPSDQIETMYPFALQGAGTASPHADDIAFLSTMYPVDDFFETTGTIRGTIFAPNGSTPLTGVNIIARNVDDPFVDAISAISGDRGVAGEFTINGLTPGANYVLFIDQILQGGFSTTPFALTAPEEFYNGDAESNNSETDDPNDSVTLTLAAGEVLEGINVILNTFAPNTPLPIGDDDSIELFLPFKVTLCGIDYESIFVNSNGSVSFGAGDTSFSETAAGMVNGPARIAGMWDDLDPTSGGSVQYDSSHRSFKVSWTDVPEFGAEGGNSFDIIISKNYFSGFLGNKFFIQHNGLTTVDGLSGYSCGNFVTSGFETASDISELSPFIPESLLETAVYEVFTEENPVDIDNSFQKYFGTKKYRDRYEGNDSIRLARFIHLPFNSADNLFRYTTLDPVGSDVDYFKIFAREGQTLIAEIQASGADTVLGVFDREGTLLASDDDGGAGVLSRVVFEIPAKGFYYIAVSAFPDLDFNGDGTSGGRYVLDAQLINGSVITLGDDDSAELTLDFDFPFQGQSFNSVFVNSNGNLTFGAGDTSFSESVFDLLNGSPRIAPLWDDLSPNAGGLVIAEKNANDTTITFQNVPEFFATTTNTFSVTLSDDGGIDIIYGDIAAVDGLAGITDGGGAIDPGPSDLSELDAPSAAGTTYELFDLDNLNDLSNTDLLFFPE